MKMVKLLLYLLFFLLPTQLGKHFWFDFSYKLGSRIDYLAPTVYFTDLLVCLIIIIFLKRSHLASLQGVTLKKSLLVFVTGLLFIAYWLFVIKENPYLLAYNLAKLVEFVLLGWIIAKTFTSKDLPQIVKILNLALILQVSLAVYQIIVEKSAGLWIIGEREFSISSIGIAKFLAPNGHQLLRGYGTFPHPNVLSGFCLLMLAANSWLFVNGASLSLRGGPQGRRSNPRDCFSRLIRRDRNDSLSWFLLGFIFSLLGVWLSMSLVAIVLSQAFLAGLVFKHLKLLKFLRSKIMIIFSFSLFILLLLAFSVQPFDFAQGKLSAKNESFSRRTALLAVASEEFRASPVFGIGLGNFISAMPQVPIDGRIYFWQPVHNIPALILAETGLAGFAVVLLLIWKGINKFKVAKKANIQIANYQLLITFWWLIILATGLFDHYWLTLQQGRLMLCLVAGLSFIHRQMSLRGMKSRSNL